MQKLFRTKKMSYSIVTLGSSAWYDSGCELYNTPVRLLSYDTKSGKYFIQLQDGTFSEAKKEMIKLKESTKCMVVNKKSYNTAGVIHSDTEGRKYKIFLVGSYKIVEVPFEEVVSLE